MGGVGTVVEDPGDLAGQVMGERIDRLENKVTLMAILSINDKERNTGVDNNQESTTKKRIKYVPLNINQCINEQDQFTKFYTVKFEEEFK